MESRNHWLDRLSDYVDGELDERDRAACEAHLADCRECGDAVEGLRAIVAQASLLPAVSPSRDLWPGIECRLEPRASAAAADAAPAIGASGRRSRSGHIAARVWRSRWTLSVPQLAAAGIGVVVLTAGAMWMLAPAVGPDVLADGADEPVQLAEVGEDAGPAAFMVAYAPAISDLEREYEARRDLLDPETRRVVEDNLMIIDGAIAEAARALAEDPSNPFVTTHLAGAMRQKVDLLRRVTSIQSKGS